ncbi:Arginase/deacetylase [Metschnikowia bicuspidata var. bicuspidata NRRL YB-4993]|uniref:Arginase/deacetylase n=1 Tax=Metschnikowia bicuspidata var. bicuspidata NRRL YB-4993 TaxID=869754 RepID=A0A1A0H5E8_9ASCO|nr:Arginase/deacetylase [Metschnikowia bicuspidata var. bicuspidata NRRL YB-4993]OBA19132.1 Arginase/deacetylase [Metschnikowia bicuspidata var. bicuspidata NRRL YB-4993]
MQRLSEIKSSHEQSARNSAHSGYLRLRAQVNLPHDDDTDDLSHGKTMFGGIVTFGRFDTFDCYDPALYDSPIDIAIVGAPFDTGTSYRPGARFGPEAIRLGGRRLKEGVTPVRTNGPGSKLGRVDPYNPKAHNLSIIDCGDVPMTPFDNRIALNQLYRGQRAIHNHTTSGKPLIPHTKILTMGGDHTITLMALRSAYEKYGRLAVLHFDSHIDTWDPKKLGGGITDYMSLNHGTFLHYAAENGYLEPHKCFHVGLRAPYIDPSYDQKHDEECGFNTITARDIDKMGTAGILSKLKETLGDIPVYISVDIDVLDPAYAPGTGTMEVGGWTTRELLTVIDGLEGLNVVGVDVVEVSPPFDTNSEVTSLAATAVMDSILGLLIVQTLD